MENKAINIRNKPTLISDSAPPSPTLSVPSELIREDLRATALQMNSIESKPTIQFKLKDPIPRSPAPLPDAVSPAGVLIDISSPELRDINADSPKSTASRGEFKIDFSSIEAMKGIDVTLDGKKPGEYRRNVKGSLMVTALFLVSVHLLLDHCTMINFVVNYDSPEKVVATVLYFISTICMLVIFLAVLIVPSLSIEEDKFPVYYGTILVAGGLDLVAVWIAGGIFSPIALYTVDSSNYIWYDWLAGLLTILINGALYYAFTTKSDGANNVHSLFHPFERIVEHENDVNVDVDQVV